jgi:hypothetical protein
MELIEEILSPIDDSSGFLRSKVDMTLLAWAVMYLCLCLDGVNCNLGTGVAADGTSSGSNKLEQKKKEKDTKEGMSHFR